MLAGTIEFIQLKNFREQIGSCSLVEVVFYLFYDSIRKFLKK